jgi:hypothetical protein
MKKNGQHKCKYLVLGRDRSYFVKKKVFIDNIFVIFVGRCLSTDSRHTYGCAPLFADLFLYSYEAGFIQGLLKKSKKKLAWSLNFTFRYIDDVISLNDSKFGDFVDRIYPIELQIKDTTDTYRSASYLDLHLQIDSERRSRTKLYDKRDDFNFPIANFPCIYSNIPAAPAYGVYISQLIRYSGACGSYQYFLHRGLLLTRRLLNQVLRSPPWLGWPPWNFCVTNDYGYVSLVVSTARIFPHSWLITGFVNKINTTGGTWVHPWFLVGFVLLDL